MSIRLNLNDILLPEDDILKYNDDVLKDRIARLTRLLEEDVPLDDVVRIKYYRTLYSKLTKENGIFVILNILAHSMQLQNILASIHDDPVPVESKGLVKTMKDLEVEPVNHLPVRDLASQTESEPFILSWSIMKSLSRQIYQELIERFGPPTVVKVAAQFITFGTKSSKILIFDLKQKLIGILDPPLRKILY